MVVLPRAGVAGTSGGVGVMGGVDAESVRALVERSCAAQGLPVKVTSPAVVEAVVSLLGTAPAPRRDGPVRSQTPDRVDPVRVDVVDAGPGRADHDMVEDGPDNRSLPVEVKRRPLAS